MQNGDEPNKWKICDDIFVTAGATSSEAKCLILK
jgi:hypothetical protein